MENIWALDVLSINILSNWYTLIRNEESTSLTFTLALHCSRQMLISICHEVNSTTYIWDELHSLLYPN